MPSKKIFDILFWPEKNHSRSFVPRIGDIIKIYEPSIILVKYGRSPNIFDNRSLLSSSRRFVLVDILIFLNKKKPKVKVFFINNVKTRQKFMNEI